MPSDEPLDDRCAARCRDGGYCTQWPIQGSNRCKMHGGLTPTKDENPDVGPPEGSANARTHGLHMKRDGYTERQDEQDQEWIYELTESLVDMWRARHGDKPPAAIRNRLENIAIDMHRVAWANDYFADAGLTQIRQEVVNDDKITTEKLTLWAGEIRQYNESIERRLDKHGLLDPPEDRGESSLPEDGHVMESDDYKITVNRGTTDPEDDDQEDE